MQAALMQPTLMQTAFTQKALIIRQSIILPAERARVWQALTEPEIISQWFEKLDFARLALGESIQFRWGEKGEIILIEPLARFGFRWQLAAPEPGRTLVIFTLETVAAGTRLTVTENGFEALPDDVRDDCFNDNIVCWGFELKRLERYLQASDHD